MYLLKSRTQPLYNYQNLEINFDAKYYSICRAFSDFVSLPNKKDFIRILFLNKKKTLDFVSPSLVTFLFPSSIWTSSSVFVLVALIFWQGVGVGSGEVVTVLLLCQAKEDTPHTSLLPQKIMCRLYTLEGYSPSIMQNAPQNGFLWYFHTTGLRLFLFGRNPDYFFLAGITITQKWDVCCWFTAWPGILTLITWLRRFLSAFSLVK